MAIADARVLLDRAGPSAVPRQIIVLLDTGTMHNFIQSLCLAVHYPQPPPLGPASSHVRLDSCIGADAGPCHPGAASYVGRHAALVYGPCSRWTRTYTPTWSLTVTESRATTCATSIPTRTAAPASRLLQLDLRDRTLSEIGHEEFRSFSAGSSWAGRPFLWRTDAGAPGSVGGSLRRYAPHGPRWTCGPRGCGISVGPRPGRLWLWRDTTFCTGKREMEQTRIY